MSGSDFSQRCAPAESWKATSVCDELQDNESGTAAEGGVATVAASEVVIGAFAALRLNARAVCPTRHPPRVRRFHIGMVERPEQGNFANRARNTPLLELKQVCEEQRGDYNVFHAFYRELVQALHETGASHYVFCVNVDAVIAALLLAVLWKDYRSGALTEKDLETAAFNVFLYGRMIGAAAEIDDHLNRGRNMDTRTPQEQCAFVV